MTPEELSERIEVQRDAWATYAAQQQRMMDTLLARFGTVEWPMDRAFAILDRAHRLTIGISRLDSHYVLANIVELRELLEMLDHHVRVEQWGDAED